MILNLFSAAMDITAVVLYSMDLAKESRTATWYCNSYNYSLYDYNESFFHNRRNDGNLYSVVQIFWQLTQKNENYVIFKK